MKKTDDDAITLATVYNTYYSVYKPSEVTLPTKEEELQRLYERYVTMYSDRASLMKRFMMAVDDGKQHCCVFSECERPAVGLYYSDLQSLFTLRLAPLLTTMLSDEFVVSQALKETSQRVFSVNLRWQLDLQ